MRKCLEMKIEMKSAMPMAMKTFTHIILFIHINKVVKVSCLWSGTEAAINNIHSSHIFHGVNGTESINVSQPIQGFQNESKCFPELLRL